MNPERPQIIGLTAEAPYIAIKRKEAIEKLGAKWLLHPDHKATRMSQNFNVLETNAQVQQPPTDNSVK